MGKGIGGHTTPNGGATDDWLTPPDIIEVMGPFDLDPCASVDQPWKTAKNHYTEDGLNRPWGGYVWCNPPYSRQGWIPWLDRLHDHGNGVALIFARTETEGFWNTVWKKADGLLFLRGRLFFHHPVTGERADHNSGGPSVLVTYGKQATFNLKAAHKLGVLKGALVETWKTLSL